MPVNRERMICTVLYKDWKNSVPLIILQKMQAAIACKIWWAREQESPVVILEPDDRSAIELSPTWTYDDRRWQCQCYYVRRTIKGLGRHQNLKSISIGTTTLTLSLFFRSWSQFDLILRRGGGGSSGPTLSSSSDELIIIGNMREKRPREASYSFRTLSQNILEHDDIQEMTSYLAESTMEP